MIKAVILDLGNVVIQTDYNRVYSILEQHSHCPKERMRDLIFASPVYRDFEMGNSSIEQFYEEVTRTIQLKMDLKQFCAVWSDAFLPEAILPDELLRTLASRYRLIALSDNNPIHFPVIRNLFPILNRFHDFTLSYQVKAIKPMPEIYEAAVQKAGCLPQECFFVDDVERNVQGARNCGLHGYRFESHEKLLQTLKERGINFKGDQADQLS